MGAARERATRERAQAQRVRPAFYAVGGGRVGELVTLLHPPYTVWHLSYFALGAAVAPTLHVDRLLWGLAAFALAVGVAAHAFDELHDRPLRTSRWNGKTIALEPFRGTTEEWSQTLRSVQFRLAWADPVPGPIGTPNDYWRFYPRIVLTIIEQRGFLPERFRHHVQDLSNWNVSEEELKALTQ